MTIDNAIHYEVIEHKDMQACLRSLIVLCDRIKQAPESEISNAFFILNKSLSFDFLLTLKEEIDVILENESEVSPFQTVVFHPDFQFADEDFHAAGNFINRSPLPMIHILRVEEVTRAIETTPSINEIPFINKKLLEEINIKSISEVFEEGFVNKTKI
jgi:hypothetical protein